LADFLLQPASERDFPAIRTLIRQVHINPTGLDWHRFIVAVTSSGEMIGCGQVKPVPGGLLELASLAVRPEFRNQGVAAALVQQLCSDSPRPLYLTCRSALEKMYKKYGFRTIEPAEVPVYYQRIQRLVGIFIGLSGSKERLLVMKLD
jgi:N-acetylglutamate synthase-like GNAT family acetyltransferase